MKPFNMAIAAAMTILVFASQGAHAEDPNRTITLSATGTILAKPDLATISTGVQTEADTAKEALVENSKKMTALLKLIKKSGIADKDVQTSQFSVSPRYANYRESIPGKRPEPLIAGYIVSNQVHVTVRNLDKIGTLLDALVEDGANKVNNIAFGFAEPEPLLDEARRKAVKEALRKGELYAEAAGVELGEVVTLNEDMGGNFPPMRAMAQAEKFGSSVPIAAGQTAINASVSMTFKLD